MPNINLLPWRDANRRSRNRIVFMKCVGMWLLAGLLVLGIKATMNIKIEYQQARNAYLLSEIQTHSKIVNDIKAINSKRETRLLRINEIQRLQKNKSLIVYVFNELATKRPKGVFYESVSKTRESIEISGKAQSNELISVLMKNLGSSNRFDEVTLEVANLDEQNGVSVTKFTIKVEAKKATVLASN